MTCAQGDSSAQPVVGNGSFSRGSNRSRNSLASRFMLSQRQLDVIVDIEERSVHGSPCFGLGQR